MNLLAMVKIKKETLTFITPFLTPPGSEETIRKGMREASCEHFRTIHCNVANTEGGTLKETAIRDQISVLRTR
jgi:hypothetical protein